MDSIAGADVVVERTTESDDACSDSGVDVAVLGGLTLPVSCALPPPELVSLPLSLPAPPGPLFELLLDGESLTVPAPEPGPLPFPLDEPELLLPLPEPESEPEPLLFWSSDFDLPSSEPESEPDLPPLSSSEPEFFWSFESSSPPFLLLLLLPLLLPEPPLFPFEFPLLLPFPLFPLSSSLPLSLDARNGRSANPPGGSGLLG